MNNSVFNFCKRNNSGSIFLKDLSQGNQEIFWGINEPVTRKPVFGVSDRVRLNPACLATETS